MTPKRRTIDARWSAQTMYPERIDEFKPLIEREVTRLFPTQPYGTHGSVCADLLFHALKGCPAPGAYRARVIKEVLDKYAPMVGTVLVYSKNDKATGRRIPKSMAEQRLAFRRNLFATYAIAVQALQNEPQHSLKPPSYQAIREAMEGRIEPEPEPEPETPEVEPEPDPLTVKSNDPLRDHHAWSVAVRKVMDERGLSWSMRPTIDGIALIAAGCPTDAVRDACLMDYPEDLRQQLGVSGPFDFASFGTVDYLTKAAKARVDDRGKLRPVCLAMVGPAGTGKTTLATVLADTLEVARYDVSMSGGTPMSAFYGIDRLNAELTLSDFERWAINGGVHLFDEMDCSDPNLLKIVNKALANRDYTNPLSGKRIELSPDAIAIAGMNTLGVGVQAEYSAAEQLDFSTIDRFRAGRVRVDIDEALEARIVEAQIESLQ